MDSLLLQNDQDKIPFLLGCEQPKEPTKSGLPKPGIPNRVEKTHAERQMTLKFSYKG